jgi:hypothetical protein
VEEVDGLSYYECKVRCGLIGGEPDPSKLTDEQRRFVGFTGLLPLADGWHDGEAIVRAFDQEADALASRRWIAKDGSRPWDAPRKGKR